MDKRVEDGFINCYLSENCPRNRDTTSENSIQRIADDLGVSYEALRQWIRQAEIDWGKREGLTTDDLEEYWADSRREPYPR